MCLSQSTMKSDEGYLQLKLHWQIQVQCKGLWFYLDIYDVFLNMNKFDLKGEMGEGEAKAKTFSYLLF